ncbi:WAP-type (Whey Acidic Protein) 'four-disulfide core' [Popillia japonica]|uniref:WAP-type (Whey Acidic Protein) 'four-disulfide core n=1 Tax=Popillia japonica TaxID=7064 RepID=A0AAW1KP16_POPJA
MRLKWTQLLLLMIAAAITENRKIDPKVSEDGKCPEITECPFNAESCFDDDDCNLGSSCCNSPCGKVCTKQLYTGCETLRQAASRRAKALGVNKKSVRMPRCSRNGGFEPVQCNNEIVSSCWCVDETGFELPGTRAPAAALVNCTEPKPCAAHTCRMFCPHGFSLAQDGCPLCKCRDPCEDIKCPDSLACHLEDLACSDPPCPPVPTCKRGRSLDNICPVGNPLRISDTVRPFLCGNEPSKPNCPPMYQCLVQTGNDYGVCCPASLKIQKTGTCPIHNEKLLDCGVMCTHDLECPSIQKCCETKQCGLSCVHPKNVTECLHQKTLSELLSINEREGKGYAPQCSEDGQFEPKQCSRNNLVCWCVDRMGRKLRGSMGSAELVNCSLADARSQVLGRSINNNGLQCEKRDCAAICEYGFKLDEDGCPTCKCDDPCEGYTCPEDEECVTVKDSNCGDIFCPTIPVCRPKALYTNPCQKGTPLTEEGSGIPIACTIEIDDSGICPNNYACTEILGSIQAVCCPLADEKTTESEKIEDDDLGKVQTMCDYLYSFSDSMEGTRDDMKIALPKPQCDPDGNFVPTQCDKDACWCVDNFGTEIPNTKGDHNSTKDCKVLRETMDCLDLTCRMGCDYGFVLEEDTGCPTCQCRDPCVGITCQKDEQCQLVEVSCKDHYCPPVPACLPKKMGQCPYIVPTTSTSCDFECSSDLACSGSMRCCSNGCGTYCTEPLLMTACQHQKLLAQHQAHESGVPANRMYMPTCNSDGTFARKQCNPGSRECWCVDSRGFEISQTRLPIGKPLDCDAPSKSQCPLNKCANNCEHGFELDSNGCRTCKCIDPCSKLSCREDGEICRLVNVECVDIHCPPVAMCLPKKDNPCHNGEPLRLGNTEETVSCGPDFESCPSSHKCQLSPLGEYAVCCPKPRDVCFESLDAGHCEDDENILNETHYYFNPKSNKCEPFVYSGCEGNHNNFDTEKLCNVVCPVLSQCERLREKNQRQSERYKKPMFTPRCETATGKWEPVQCLDHVGVCWCVNPQGEPLKGTLTRGNDVQCNFRQARNRANSRIDTNDDADLVLEELMMQLGDFDMDDDQEMEEDSLLDWELPLSSRCEAVGGACDSNGQFLPGQCDRDMCWCVDEAGNQLPNTSSFKKGEQLCLPTPIASVDVILGFRGEYDDVNAVPVVNQITKIVRNLRGTVSEEGIFTEISNDILFVKFSLIGSNKIDVAYRLEQMVTQQRLPGLTADITRSRFIHKMGAIEPLMSERVVALEHREIVSQSPVSFVTHYHTALIVVAAASAFVGSMNNMANKIVEDNQRFLSLNRPIYIELPNEKGNQSQTENVTSPT